MLDLTLEQLQQLPPGGLSVNPDPEGAELFRRAWAEFSRIFNRRYGHRTAAEREAPQIALFRDALARRKLRAPARSESRSARPAATGLHCRRRAVRVACGRTQACRGAGRQPRLELRSGGDRVFPRRLPARRAGTDQELGTLGRSGSKPRVRRSPRLTLAQGCVSNLIPRVLTADSRIRALPSITVHERNLIKRWPS